VKVQRSHTQKQFIKLHRQNQNGVRTFWGVQEQPHREEYDRPPHNLEKLLKERVFPPPPEWEHQGHAHYPDEPREDEVSHGQTVPHAVVEEPVASSTIVDKDHDGEGETAQEERKKQT